MAKCLLAIVLMIAKLTRSAPHKITIPQIHGQQYHASYFIQIGHKEQKST